MKIVLAYSGGLDTSVLLSWIKEKYNAEMIAFCANIGQEDELRGLETKAKKTGASKIYIDDLQEEFARDFIYPMIQAGAIYEGQYFLGTSIARPLIAKRMVEIAKKEKADAIAHGATGKGNDQVRFELTAAALAPDLQVIAPWRDERYRSEFPGRQEMIDYCAAHKIPVQASAKKPFSMDRNLLHISYEAGILEDPWFDSFDPKNKNYFTTLSVFPEDAPNKPEFVTLDFVKGNCVAVNGKKLSPLGVMRALNKLGGKHGVGRVDMVENRFVGMKSRGVYETPGGAILHFAHRQMESLTMDREVMHQRDALIPKYAELVYNGFWYAPERLALQAYVTESQKNVTGTVRVKLYKGNLMVSGRKSVVSLYNPHIATMEADPTCAYNQDDATGFIRLNALRLKVAAKVQSEKIKAIHLVQNNPNLLPKLIALGSQTYESGFWTLSSEQAKSLIGGNIFFHEKQISPSFFGGVIKDCWVQQGGEWDGRVVFKFDALASHQGIRPKNPDGWNRVMNFEE